MNFQTPVRVGWVIKIIGGDLAGFTGQVVFIGDDYQLLVVDTGTRETRWVDYDHYNGFLGYHKWFERVETATTPIEILDDLIKDWDRFDLDAHYKYTDVVDVLIEAKDRISKLAAYVALPKRFTTPYPNLSRQTLDGNDK